MQKLSSFGRGKKFRPKQSLTSLLHAALQFLFCVSFNCLQLCASLMDTVTVVCIFWVKIQGWIPEQVLDGCVTSRPPNVDPVLERVCNRNDTLLILKKSNFFDTPFYSRTSPYGHLYNTDTSLLRTVSLVPKRPNSIQTLPL